MKRILGVLMITLMVSGSSVFAQKAGYKFGHINSNELLSLMPERDSAQAQLQKYSKMLQDEMQSMQTELQNKYAEYEQKQATYTDLVKKSREQEIQDLQRRVQEFQSSAQQNYQQKQSELFKPIMDKAQKAIEKVAKENGFTYIFDLGAGGVLYYSDQSIDILPLVKKELGIQ